MTHPTEPSTVTAIPTKTGTCTGEVIWQRSWFDPALHNERKLADFFEVNICEIKNRTMGVNTYKVFVPHGQVTVGEPYPYQGLENVISAPFTATGLPLEVELLPECLISQKFPIDNIYKTEYLYCEYLRDYKTVYLTAAQPHADGILLEIIKISSER